MDTMHPLASARTARPEGTNKRMNTSTGPQLDLLGQFENASEGPQPAKVPRNVFAVVEEVLSVLSSPGAVEPRMDEESSRRSRFLLATLGLLLLAMLTIAIAHRHASSHVVNPTPSPSSPTETPSSRRTMTPSGRPKPHPSDQPSAASSDRPTQAPESRPSPDPSHRTTSAPSSLSTPTPSSSSPSTALPTAGGSPIPTTKYDHDRYRFKRVHDCASFLSNLSARDTIPTDIFWFIHGPGRNIQVPSGCTWDSTFGRFYALVVTRDSLGVKDRSWHAKDDVVEHESQACKWTHILCNRDNQIAGLELSNANLDGSMPMELQGLASSNLVSLKLDGNPKLDGTIPSELSSLVSLQYLWLDNTSITGTVPSELGLLVHLKELLLDHASLTGDIPDSICHLPSLVTLRVDCHGEHAPVHCSCCSTCRSGQFAIA